MIRCAVFDIETNGLIREGDKFHCAWIADITCRDDIKYHGFRPQQYHEFLQELKKYDIVIGHNIQGFDIPWLRLYLGLSGSFVVIDTLALYRFLDPSRKNASLKALGDEAQGNRKTSFEVEEAGQSKWDVFTEAMYQYCKDDVKTNVDGFFYLADKLKLDYQSQEFIDVYKVFYEEV